MCKSVKVKCGACSNEEFITFDMGVGPFHLNVIIEESSNFKEKVSVHICKM